jgi:hypothetical protein
MSESQFASAVRSAVRGVWSGALSPSQGSSALATAVQSYLREAWLEGAARCGILPGELSAIEESELLNFVYTQQAFTGRLMRDVYRNRQAVGGKLDPFLSRATLWVNRYHHARQLGKQMACADRKMIWRLGPTGEHCADCARADGRVHRASIWKKYGWEPGSHRLACRGFNCSCTLEITDEPALPGHPPYVRGA